MRIRWRRHLIRSEQTGYLDLFLVSAALTVLTLRVYLAAAHYPQLGGGGLHVAHVLWGGLGMVVAIGVLLVFLSRNARLVAALVGGIGFGAFVDELGKFLTSDNNYFFKPTAALIYTIFVVLFLVARRLGRTRKLSPEENLVNAIELAKEDAAGRMSRADRDRALMLLAGADQANPLVPVLRDHFLALSPVAESPGLAVRGVSAAERGYAAIVGNSWFRRVIASVFILQAAGTVFLVFGATLVAGAALFGNAAARSSLGATSATGLTRWIVTGASLLAGVLTVAGVVALRRSRLRAYRAFELSVLVDLLLAQPFTLLDAGFPGLADVFVDLVLLAVLGYMQTQERRLVGWAPAGDDEHTGQRSGGVRLSGLSVRWVVAGAVVALLIALVTPVVVVTAYGLGLGLMTNSAADQSAVNAFWNTSAGWSLLCGAALGVVVGATIARRNSRS